MCKHKLAPLEYYYDDDWGHKGHKVWDEQTGLPLKLCYCKECGQVFVVPPAFEFERVD